MAFLGRRARDARVCGPIAAPQPPLELLELVKDFAKANADHPENGLPKEIAAVLYYGCIAAALVRLKARISKLSDAELRRGLGWAVEQPWVDEETRQLLARAVMEITPGGARDGSGMIRNGTRRLRMGRQPAEAGGPAGL